MYKKGDWVRVVGFKDAQAVLRVWEVRKRGAILLSEDKFQRALEGEDVDALGFPMSDIKGLAKAD